MYIKRGGILSEMGLYGPKELNLRVITQPVASAPKPAHTHTYTINRDAQSSSKP